MTEHGDHMGEMTKKNNDTKQFFMDSLNSSIDKTNAHFKLLESKIWLSNEQIDKSKKEIALLDVECKTLNLRSTTHIEKLTEHANKLIALDMGKFDSNALGSFKDDIYKALVTMERSLVKADNEM
jgi:hypothetical protein